MKRKGKNRANRTKRRLRKNVTFERQTCRTGAKGHKKKQNWSLAYTQVCMCLFLNQLWCLHNGVFFTPSRSARFIFLPIRWDKSCNVLTPSAWGDSDNTGFSPLLLPHPSLLSWSGGGTWLLSAVNAFQKVSSQSCSFWKNLPCGDQKHRNH